jgi:hypothetical protein
MRRHDATLKKRPTKPPQGRNSSRQLRGWAAARARGNGFSRFSQLQCWGITLDGAFCPDPITLSLDHGGCGGCVRRAYAQRRWGSSGSSQNTRTNLEGAPSQGRFCGADCGYRGDLAGQARSINDIALVCAANVSACGFGDGRKRGIETCNRACHGDSFTHRLFHAVGDAMLLAIDVELGGRGR